MNTLSDPTATDYTDANVDVDNHVYYYQIQHKDICDNTITSSIGQSILLNAVDVSGQGTQVTWTPMELTGATVKNYVLYKSESETDNYTQLTTLDNNTFAYTDQINIGAGQYNVACYRVEAVYDYTCPQAGGTTVETLNSFSNTACVKQNSKLFVPNAFKPNGKNNLFKPVILFPNYDDYQMNVMNRWGEIVFQTTNPDEGWTGEYKGDRAPQDVYTYSIQMRSQLGDELIERKGTVLLLW